MEGLEIWYVTPSHTISAWTLAVKRNGFNLVWEEKLSISFECVGDMFDLIFVKFVVKQKDKVTNEPIYIYFPGGCNLSALRSPCSVHSEI